jgi:DNA repair exonuclease SbcCD ATPase subunit
MMALFRRLEAVFPQIILISHVPEVQNESDHAVLIDFDEGAGCSRVRCLTGAGV